MIHSFHQPGLCALWMQMNTKRVEALQRGLTFRKFPRTCINREDLLFANLSCQAESQGRHSFHAFLGISGSQSEDDGPNLRWNELRGAS